MHSPCATTLSDADDGLASILVDTMSQLAIDPSMLGVPQRAPEDAAAAQPSEEELRKLEERDRSVLGCRAVVHHGRPR